jgi:hypothetical protein
MKKLGLIILSLFLFSFTVSNHLFNYKILSVISVEKINGNPIQNLEPILSDALISTKNDLSFKLKSKTSLVFKTKVGNCVGYAKYYNKKLFEELKKNNVGNVTISHARAKVLFMGQNIHFSNSPSLKDHDISIVKNNTTGDVYYIDPSLSEVFGNIIVKQ